MSKAIITADPTTTVFQAAKIMEQGGIGSILVKKDGTPAGIITDRDFAVKVAVEKLSMDTTIDKVASYPLVTINPNDSLGTAAQIMSSKKIRKLAVQEGDQIVGIITSTNIVNYLARQK